MRVGELVVLIDILAFIVTAFPTTMAGSFPGNGFNRVETLITLPGSSSHQAHGEAERSIPIYSRSVLRGSRKLEIQGNFKPDS